MNGPSMFAGFVALGLVMAGCTQGSAGVSTAEESVDETAAAFLNDQGYWTGEISDETQPVSCKNGYVVDQMRCRLDNCDNVSIHCSPTGHDYRERIWTSWFSDGSNNRRDCPGDMFVVGVACRGSYCDNMSLQCAKFENYTGNSAARQMSSWFSDEQYESRIPAGYIMKGLYCSGNYCDDLTPIVCPY